MFVDLEKVAIYVKPGKTDLRKQINGLSIVVQEDLKLDLFSGALFLFCNGQRRLLKILYWDRTGFCLWSKRLERGLRFPWPRDRGEVERIDLEKLRLLMSGIDFWKAHEELKFSAVC